MGCVLKIWYAQTSGIFADLGNWIAGDDVANRGHPCTVCFWYLPGQSMDEIEGAENDPALLIFFSVF
uniref:Uncharacterized protein n=1 Tax=Setaria viridis TaxID=4556 RepID=A0A4U6VMN3_SETVI|nr:hypothetical protein SEVIR_2G003575v2 [Setaria viridis]